MNKRGLFLAVLFVSSACGLAARPPVPGRVPQVENFSVQVEAGVAVLTWMGRPAPEVEEFHVLRREEARAVPGSLPVPASPFAVVGRLPALRPQKYRFVDEGLAAKRTYQYRIRTVPWRKPWGVEATGPQLTLSWERPPAPPGGVLIKPVPGGVQVGWDEVSGASGYRVFRWLDGQVQSTHVAMVVEHHYVDLSPGAGEARYVVRAIRDRDSGTPLEGASSVSVTLVEDEERIPPPTGLTGVWGKEGVALAWRARLDAPAGTGYHVYRRRQDETSSLFEKLTRKPLRVPTFLDATAQQGVRYLYHVRSVDAAGRAGQPSHFLEM